MDDGQASAGEEEEARLRDLARAESEEMLREQGPLPSGLVLACFRFRDANACVVLLCCGDIFLYFF